MALFRISTDSSEIYYREHFGFLANLSQIPKRILMSIRKLSAQFLWNGNSKKGGLSLVKWQRLEIPKKFGV